MAEDSGRHDHFGMVTALENLQIGAAGERGFDADADLAGFESRRRDFFNLFFPCRAGWRLSPRKLTCAGGLAEACFAKAHRAR